MSWVSLSSDGDSEYRKVANDAFASPTSLGAKLGSRADGASVGSSSGSSRRAPSLVQSEDEAEELKEILASTQVVVPQSHAQSVSRSNKASEHSNINSSVRSNQSKSGRSKQPSVGVASMKSNAAVSEKQKANAASAHSNQSVSSISASVHESKRPCEHSSSRPPPAQGSRHSQITGTSHSRPPVTGTSAQRSQVSGTSSVSSTSEINSMNSGSAGRKDLDLMHNDNSFHVIGGLIVEFFHSKQQPDSASVKLTRKDLDQLDRLAPPRVRSSFVEAVRHRFTNAPTNSNNSVHVLARQCHELGLDAEETQNPLLVTADAAIQLVIPVPSASLTPKEKPAAAVAASNNYSKHSAAASNNTKKSNYDESESSAHDTKSAVASTASKSAVTEPGAASAHHNDSQRSETRKRSNHDQSGASSVGKHEYSPYTEHSVTGKSENGAKPGQGAETETAVAKDGPARIDFTNAISAAFSDLKSMATSMGKSNAAVPTTASMPSESDVDDDSNKVGMQAALLSNLSSRMDESSYVPNVTSADGEGIARQQLVAELQEASNLMAESKTQEAAKFWRDHVVELEARLRALDGEDKLTAPPETQKSFLASVGGKSRGDQSSLGKSSRGGVQSQSQSEVLLNTNKSSKIASVNRYQPPAFKDEEEEALSSPRKTDNRSGGVSKGASNGKRVVGSVPLNIDPSLEGVPMVDVVAPAELPGGYHFEAEIEGRRFLATVPAGGVQKGETFSCYMRDLSLVGSGVPVGRWRDGLLDCCILGCCHAVFWNALFCPLILLRQILTRVGFDFLGRPATKRNVNSPKTLMTILGFWFFVNVGLFCAYNFKWSQGMGLSTADLGALAFVNISYLLFVMYLVASTRGSIREKYYIRESQCHDVEDCCCATFCLPCSLCQMARHTADYDQYEGVCCNATGLPDCYTLPAPPRSPKHVV